MATPLKPRTYVPRLRDNRIDGVKYNRSSSKRNNFEMFAWLGMRLSGVVLVVLIFGHLFSNLMVGDGIHAMVEDHPLRSMRIRPADWYPHHLRVRPLPLRRSG